MTEQWVRDNLFNLLRDNLIIIKESDGDFWGIPIQDFIALFVSVQNPDYQSLRSALPEESGWPATFDTWKSQGLIN